MFEVSGDKETLFGNYGNSEEVILRLRKPSCSINKYFCFATVCYKEENVETLLIYELYLHLISNYVYISIFILSKIKQKYPTFCLLDSGGLLN